MSEAVPIASFVAMSASLLRFVTNFKQRHPSDPNRTAINYDIVEICLSLTFLGTFMGVQVAKTFGEVPMAVIYCITIAWSIWTTDKKVDSIKKVDSNEKVDSNDEEEASTDSENKEKASTDSDGKEEASIDSDHKD